MEIGTQRRLTTIVAADIAGFSRLVGFDEEGTLAAQRSYRTEIIEPLLAQHNGRIANTAGDSFLFEFPSAVEAVRCVMAVQTGIAERNSNIPSDRRIEYRVGINVGDVVAEGNDLLGDGVNIAARLENICEPGGIILSDDAYRQVRDRLDVSWEDGGEHEVKNIARPIQVWHWATDQISQSVKAKPDTNALLPLPDKPSIAVLAFDNMSGDPEQEYFSDGITEDIITALSRVGWFFVIARNSSFTYKGRAIDVRQVAEELGVRYILEGSVRKGGTRLRITAQLIEAATGNHTWADRYDGQIDDIFDFQDQVTESVVNAIEPKLRQSEISRSLQKRAKDLDAYDLFLRGLQHISVFEKSRNTQARTHFDAALAIDPQYVPALAYGSWCRAVSVIFNWSDDPVKENGRALKMARTALEISPEDATALRMAGFTFSIVQRDHGNGRALIDKSLAYDPNSALSWVSRAWTNLWDDRPGEAEADFEHAIRLNPLDPWAFQAASGMSYALVGLGRFEEALPWARKAAREMPSWITVQRGLAITLGHLGRDDEAKEVVREMLRIDPEFTISRFAASIPFKEGLVQERVIEGMRKAGVPE